MTETTQPDAFEQAVAQVRPADESDPQPRQDGAGATEPAPGSTGRKKDKSGAQKRKERDERDRRARAGGAAEVKGPPPPAEKIPPEAVAALIRQIDAAIVGMARTVPITSEDAKNGGEVWAPILDHYFPQIAERGGIWMAPTMWTLGVYGPRILEIFQRRQAARTLGDGKPAPAEPQEEAQPAKPATEFRQGPKSDPAHGYIAAAEG